MKKTIGIFAHVDAGKTTFSEQLLYQTNSINHLGRVDYKNAFLDYNDIERERGITIFSEVGIVSYENNTYYIIDTPGHVDFSPEAERAMQILDYAIILVSAVEGIESHTETVWQLLRKYRIPTFFFINKIDRIGIDIDKVISDLKNSFNKNTFDLEKHYNDGNLNKDLVEFIAESNEDLLNLYLDGLYEQNLWMNQLNYLIKNNTLFFYGKGSSLYNQGIMDFLKTFDKLTDTFYIDNEQFSARVFRIRHDDQGAKLTFIKVLSGKLRVRMEVAYEKNEKHYTEKITQIRIYNGNTYTSVDEVSSGDVCCVMGLSEVKIGTGLNCDNLSQYEFRP